MTSRKRPLGRLPSQLTVVLTAALAALVLLSGTAAAGRLVDAAVDGLRDNPIYVSDAADPKPTKGQQDELRQHISGADVPIYVAILPEAALNEAGGNASGVAGAIAQSLKRPGVYAVIVGGHFAAGSTSGVMPKGTTPQLATQAVEAHRGKPDARQATLLDFVDRVKAAAAQGGTGGAAAKDSGSGSGVGTVLAIAVVVLLVVAGGALVVRSRRRRREREQQLAEVKALAQEDLVALGEDIRALDIDTQMPGVNPEAVSQYSAAVDSYQKAADALDRARRPEEMATVSSALEAGRFSMASTKALLEGKPLPERRPPCFFDPRHGPSVEDVTWAPPDGVPREVPACATCAHQVRNGIEPQSREVLVGDRQVPFWRAPAYYGPWYGGYFGGGAGGFLTGMLIGQAFGGFGGWGGGYYGDGGGGDGGGGDGGNGGDWATAAISAAVTSGVAISAAAATSAAAGISDPSPAGLFRRTCRLLCLICRSCLPRGLVRLNYYMLSLFSADTDCCSVVQRALPRMVVHCRVGAASFEGVA